MSVSGSVILIESAKEKLLHIETRRKIDLLKIAYHLGNRHSPIQINHSWLRILDDPVLTHIVQGLGGVTKSIEAAGYKPSDDVMIALDAAASEFCTDFKSLKSNSDLGDSNKIYSLLLLVYLSIH